MPKKQTRLEELNESAGTVGLYICTYNPGGTTTRYRFFRLEDGKRHSSYFGPGNGIFTAMGYKEACTYLRGAGA